MVDVVFNNFSQGDFKDFIKFIIKNLGSRVIGIKVCYYTFVMFMLVLIRNESVKDFKDQW